jgi:drug/metabolite transporter (DMT)-like permease
MQMSPAPSSSKKGIFYMLLAMFIFAVVNIIVKDTTTKYAIIQVVFFRCFFMLIPASLLVAKNGTNSLLQTKNLKLHLICGILGVADLLCLFATLHFLPLAEATTLSFSTILFITALSGPLLKEWADKSRWLAILIGFIGVLIVAKPTTNIFDTGAIYGILFAVFDAYIMINMRIITRTDPSEVAVFYFSLISSVTCLLILPFFWTTPTNLDLLKLISLGIGGGLGQVCITRAYQYAPAAAVAPMIYSSILWGALFGFLFWNEIPSLSLTIGCGLIIIGGIAIIISENKAAKQIVDEKKLIEE